MKGITHSLRSSRTLALAAIVALVLTAGWWLLSVNGKTSISALFDTGVGVYEGSEVRVLGLGVGEVTSVHPQGRHVKVDMEIDDGVEIPATAQALVIAPSLVADRYLQLTPRYRGGPTMASGTTIPPSRTATPVEIDQLLASVDKLATALGPEGANAEGALSRLLDVGAENLKGNGRLINETLNRIAELSATLSGNRGDLFASVDNLRTFIGTLAASDTQVRELTTRLADVVGFLGNERDDLGGALHELAGALGDVRGFVRDNRTEVRSNVRKLAATSRVLVDQRAALAEILEVAPTGLNNLINGYDAASGTLQARLNLNELAEPPLLTVCELIKQTKPRDVPDVLAKACEEVSDILNDKVQLPSAAELISDAQQGELPPLPLVSGGSR